MKIRIGNKRDSVTVTFTGKEEICKMYVALLVMDENTLKEVGYVPKEAIEPVIQTVTELWNGLYKRLGQLGIDGISGFIKYITK